MRLAEGACTPGWALATTELMGAVPSTARALGVCANTNGFCSTLSSSHRSGVHWQLTQLLISSWFLLFKCIYWKKKKKKRCSLEEEEVCVFA